MLKEPSGRCLVKGWCSKMAKWEEILQVACKTAAVAFVGAIVGEVAKEVLPTLSPYPQPSQLPQHDPTEKNEAKRLD